MNYRGEDLDLRTPQTWSAPGAEPVADSRGPLRGLGPIWVDDTVLAVSNHAFDVALAHRAGEVRLEHLLHALTRIETAAEALEARGVRVAALRRESATIIASEIPASLPNGKGSPRRSEDFAEVLRLAAANAQRRNAPAGIEDLLYVLFERADMPGLALLSRHTVRAHREAEIQPPIRYIAEPRYVPQPPPKPVYSPSVEAAPRLMRETATDSIQNSRLDALEQMVRALSSDLSSERQIVSGLLKELSQQTQEQRGDQTRLQSVLAERLAGLEQAVSQSPRGATLLDAGLEQRLNDLARTWSTLSDRLAAMEAALEPRLNDLSRNWATASERLLSTDGALGQRLVALENTVAQRLADSARMSAALMERVDRLLRDKPGVDATQLADLPERLRAAVDLSPISHRLDVIEEALLASDPRKGDDVVKQVDDRLEQIHARIGSLEGEVRQALSANSSGVRQMENLLEGFERQRGEALNGMLQPVFERVSALVGPAQAHQAQSTETLRLVVERLAAVEQALGAEIETTAVKHQAYAQDLTDVHDALMKLNQNQHTLAGSIDQWRTDAAGDLSVISNRLTNLDNDSERPFETLKALSLHMDNMNKLMVERYHRRNRFWYWLFGTDDWIGASWPSQAAALESERQKFKAPKTA